MATQSNRVASWYWVTCAALTPFVLVATIVWAYYALQSQGYRAEAARLERGVDAEFQRLEVLAAHMKELATVAGFPSGDPFGKKDSLRTRAEAPARMLEASKDRAEQNIVHRHMADAESRFYGGEAAGYIHQYMSAREYIAEVEKQVKQYLAFKQYQGYSADGIEPDSAKLARPLEERQGRYFAPTAAQEAAAARATAKDAITDPAMRTPTQLTMEHVYQTQMRLINDLVSANKLQYGLLYSDASGRVNREGGTPGLVGFEAQEAQRAAMNTATTGLQRGVNDRKNSALQPLGGLESTMGAANNRAADRKRYYELTVTARRGSLETLERQFTNERENHQADAAEFVRLTRNLPLLKSPIKMEKREPDGEVTFSDYSRRVAHINLGRADGVRAGQRFEVWRLHGREQDRAIGVIEIVRTLSDHYSLCTVLSLVDDNEPVRKNDKIISRIWHDGRFLSIALHGTFEAPTQAYSAERLTELLRQAGCTVVEKVHPGTDLVITGSNLLADAWYRQAQQDIRFETLREEDIRLYVNPR